MQTVKAALFIFICLALLGACGLKGPLYLEDGKPASETLTGQESSVDEEKLETPDEGDEEKPDLN